MAIKINISDVTMKDDSELMRGASFRGTQDVELEVSKLKLHQNAKVLEDLKIEPIIEELENVIVSMDKNSSEYLELQKILSVKDSNKTNILKMITKHIGNFTQGVLASIVANKLQS